MRIYLDPIHVSTPNQILKTNYRELFLGTELYKVITDRSENPVVFYVDVTNEEHIELLQSMNLELSPHRIEEIVDAVELFKEADDEQITEDIKPATYLSLLEVVGPFVSSRLEKAGYEFLFDLGGLTEDELVNIPGVGQASALKLLAALA